MDGGSSGDATLHIGYAGANFQVFVEVIVNGVSQGQMALSSSHSWSQFTSADIPISGLNAGETNTIRIVCGNNGGINPDFIQVVYDK